MLWGHTYCEHPSSIRNDCPPFGAPVLSAPLTAKMTSLCENVLLRHETREISQVEQEFTNNYPEIYRQKISGGWKFFNIP